MMHIKYTQLLCRHLFNYCADTQGVTGPSMAATGRRGRSTAAAEAVPVAVGCPIGRLLLFRTMWRAEKPGNDTEIVF